MAGHSAYGLEHCLTMTDFVSKSGTSRKKWEGSFASNLLRDWRDATGPKRTVWRQYATIGVTTLLGSLDWRGHVLPVKPMQLCPVAAHTNRPRQVSLNSLDV